jgi:hypothetical protein
VCVCVCMCVDNLIYQVRDAYAPCSNLWSALVYSIFQHCLKNTRFSGNKIIEHKMFWFSPRRLSETFFILRTAERNIIKNLCRSSWKIPVILIWYYEIGIFHRFSKNSQVLNFMKVLSVGVVPWGQTDMINLAVTFRSVVKTLKNSYLV